MFLSRYDNDREYMASFVSDLVASWWQYKGKRKQEKGRQTGNERLLAEGKRDELAGMIKAKSGCPIDQAIQAADENNV